MEPAPRIPAEPISAPATPPPTPPCFALAPLPAETSAPATPIVNHRRPFDVEATVKEEVADGGWPDSEWESSDEVIDTFPSFYLCIYISIFICS